MKKVPSKVSEQIRKKISDKVHFLPSTGKVDIKKLHESNKSEINRLIKQHEINLDALKEKHKLDMEAKDKEQEFKF